MSEGSSKKPATPSKRGPGHARTSHEPSAAERREAALRARPMSRREVIKRVATVGIGAVATATLGPWMLRREDEPRAALLTTIPDHRIVLPAGAVQMAIARGPDAAGNVRRAMAALGGMERFVRPGERVVIKPNIGWNRLPEQGANTHPDIVAELVRQCVAAGAAKVWVTDVPVNNPERCFARSGIAAAAQTNGATLVLPDESGFRSVAVGGDLLRVAEVLWPFVEADRVINVPVVKQHSLCAATMSMKNWYGVLGGHRVRLHQNIHRSIIDLSRMMKPTLTVMDAMRVMMANGPSGGSLDDVRSFDSIAISADEVALDAFGAGFLGLNPRDLPFIVHAEAAGLGRVDYRGLKLVEI